jgi:hypothetical protein
MQVVECNYNLEKAIFILANIDKSQVKLRKSIVEAHNIGSTATRLHIGFVSTSATEQKTTIRTTIYI